jgi:hypothetical protein
MAHTISWDNTDKTVVLQVYSFPARENHDLKVVDESARFLHLPLK